MVCEVIPREKPPYTSYNEKVYQLNSYLHKALRTFALIVSAHPYCARKFTCHAMPRHASSARGKCQNEQ